MAIVGAGIVGVFSAYELAADGHEVTVFDRADAVAAGASFASGSVVAPALVGTGPALGLDELAPRLAGLGYAGWAWRQRRAARAAGGRTGEARTRLLRLAEAGRDRLHALHAELRLDIERADGVLVLLRRDADLKRARAAIKRLAELGVAFELLDAARAREHEPGLDEAAALRAALHLPAGGVVNCRQFAHALRSQAQRLGVRWELGHAVRALRAGMQPAVVVDEAPRSFDAVVVAAGAEAAELLAPLGLRLALAPVWGHAITAPLREVDGIGLLGPRAALVDERHAVTIVRLGRRVRVAGGAELGGGADAMRDATLATLYAVLHDWFPGAAQLAQVQRWKGARAMLPDGLPLVGPAGPAGIWLNLGHGGGGWTLAAATARWLADGLGGRASALDGRGLGVERLR